MFAITIKQETPPGDEIANVNFLCDDKVHVLQNTSDSCINSSTDRRGCVVTHSLLNAWNACTECVDCVLRIPHAEYQIQ